MNNSHEHITWKVTATVDKYRDGKLYDSIRQYDNLLMIGGASALFERLIGTSVTAFDNSNAYLGVGNGTTTEASTQTDLQGGSKSRKAMSATYPQHTDSTSDTAAQTITFKSSWDTASGNFAWNEWGLFNASSSGRMLNRKVTSFGTKTSADTWTLTITATIA